MVPSKIISSFWGIVSYIRNIILLGSTSNKNATHLKGFPSKSVSVFALVSGEGGDLIQRMYISDGPHDLLPQARCTFEALFDCNPLASCRGTSSKFLHLRSFAFETAGLVKRYIRTG